VVVAEVVKDVLVALEELVDIDHLFQVEQKYF
jgi:hypothetical protein